MSDFVYTIYEKTYVSIADIEVDSFDTLEEAKWTLDIIIKYSDDKELAKRRYYIRKHKLYMPFFEDADCLCYPIEM